MGWNVGSARKVFEALLAYRVGLISGDIDSLEARIAGCGPEELTVARMTHILQMLERAQAALAEAVRDELPPLPEETTRS